MKSEFTKEDLERIGDLPAFLCKRRGNILTFRCPACKREHTHGTGAAIYTDGPEPFTPSHRLAHCHTKTGEEAFPRGYYVYYAE